MLKPNTFYKNVNFAGVYLYVTKIIKRTKNEIRFIFEWYSLDSTTNKLVNKNIEQEMVIQASEEPLWLELPDLYFKEKEIKKTWRPM